MIKVKDFMEAVSYRITDGAQYCWDCYGPDARSMDYWNGKHGNEGVTVYIVYDTKTQVVYQMEAWDYAKEREYRWINPHYRAEHKDEAERRDVSFTESYDSHTYIDLDEADDMLEKATAIANGEEYDARVIVQIELDDKDLLELMKMAHEADVTLNQFIETLLRKKIKELAQPTWP